MRGKKDTEPRSWVTRERPKIDRIACPWLIRRFIDPEAEFLFAPTERVFAVAAETGATAYDIPGAEPFSHDGELCSFDAFLKVYGIEDPALDALALIVRGADTARLELTPQSPGLLAHLARPLGDLRRRPHDARARDDRLRRALCLVPRLSRPGARLEPGGHGDESVGGKSDRPRTGEPRGARPRTAATPSAPRDRHLFPPPRHLGVRRAGGARRPDGKGARPENASG